jgi:hypothetical protein
MSYQCASDFVVSKSRQNECVSPTTPTAPRKTYQMSPMKSPAKTPRKDSRHDTELKILTSMVQDLAEKLKKRDRQVRQMQEKVDKLTEVTMELENAEERLVDAAAENQTLSRRVKNLQSTIISQDGNPAAKEPTIPTKRVDETELRFVRQQRDSAMDKAGEMSVALAESRAESDELRDAMVTITALLHEQNNVSSRSLIPESPGSTMSPAKSMRRLSLMQQQDSGSSRSLVPESPVTAMSPGGKAFRRLSSTFLMSPKAPGRPPLF